MTVMALSGELDASNYLRLVDDVRPLYTAGTRHLLLDLTDLTFISSSGLVSLYSILKVMQGEEPPDPIRVEHAHAMEDAAEEGTSQNAVRLAGMQPAVAEVIQRTGIEALFRATRIASPDRGLRGGRLALAHGRRDRRRDERG